MDKRVKQYLAELEHQYIVEVRNFLKALQKNATLKELLTIRKNAKEIFDEIKNRSNLKDYQND